MENYQLVKDIMDGHHAVVRLMRHKETKELVAVKFTPRGDKIDEMMAREIINHKSLCHPNIIRFKEVFLTPTHIAMAMEYASGDLFDYVSRRRRLSEDEGICHRDLKLENTLLDGQRIKICDFGFSKSYLHHSRPNSRLGGPGYIAPEILSCKEYDGTLADIWSCGVMLYVMLVGALPFEDQQDPQNVSKTVNLIMAAQYKIPAHVYISQGCRNLISGIFVANPSRRITMEEIKCHPWFLKDLPKEFTEEAQAVYYRKENLTTSRQSIEDIISMVKKARALPTSFRRIKG